MKYILIIIFLHFSTFVNAAVNTPFIGNDYKLTHKECLFVVDKIVKFYLNRISNYERLSCKDVIQLKNFLRELSPDIKISVRKIGEYRSFKKSEFREVIPVSRKIDEKNYYFRIDHFPRNTKKIILDVLKSVKGKNFEYLVIDLRNNTGGILNSTIESADLFVPKNKLISTIESRNSNQNMKYYSTNQYFSLGIPKIIILVSNKTAVGAELFISILKEYTTSILVGEPTAGIGTVRTVIPVNPDKLLSIVSGQFYGPNKVKIHGNSITPDIKWAIGKDINDKLENDNLSSIIKTVADYTEGLKDKVLDLRIDTKKSFTF